MNYELFTHSIPANQSRNQLVEKIGDIARRIEAALPATVKLSTRVTAINWSVLDVSWPGGNAKEWFGARTMLKPAQNALNAAILEVVIFVDETSDL